MNQINLLQPEFVINVGDLIEGYPEDRADLNGMWDEADVLLDKLDMPFFRTIGNHDVSTQKQKKYGLRGMVQTTIILYTRMSCSW